ncbi:MAG: hypothetical protein U0Z44_08280 [Kouleothrix sp.]
MPFFTLLATVGLVVSALALLHMYARIFNGPLNPRWDSITTGAHTKRLMRVASRRFWRPRRCCCCC